MDFKIYRHTIRTGWKLQDIGYHDLQQAISVYRNMDSARPQNETLALISTDIDATQLWFQHGPERSLPPAQF